MKNIIFFTLLVFSNLSGFGQEKCNYMNVINDDVTAKTSIESDDLQVEGFSIKIIAATIKSEYPIMVFQANKDYCVDKLDNIYILFRNGERIESYNTSFVYNCDGISGFKLDNPDYVRMLKSLSIKTIRFDVRKYHFQSDLSQIQSDKIANWVNCAFNRSSWEENIKY